MSILRLNTIYDDIICKKMEISTSPSVILLEGYINHQEQSIIDNKITFTETLNGCENTRDDAISIKTKTIGSTQPESIYIKYTYTIQSDTYGNKTVTDTYEVKLEGRGNYAKTKIKLGYVNKDVLSSYEVFDVSIPIKVIESIENGFMPGTKVGLPTYAFNSIGNYQNEERYTYKHEKWRLTYDEPSKEFSKDAILPTLEYSNGRYIYTVGNIDATLIAEYVPYTTETIKHVKRLSTSDIWLEWGVEHIECEVGTGFNPTDYKKDPPTGYHFVDYELLSANTDQSITKGDYQTYSNYSCHFKLYYDLNQYTVTLNANGGSVGTGSVTTTYSKGDYCNLSWNTPTRTGYIFDGWYTQASGGTKVYNADGSCTNEGTYWSGNLWQYDGNPTFYAHWIPITYTVAYNGNGATEGSTSSTTHTYDSSTNLATNGFKRKYTVTFEGNGGSNPSNQVSEYGFHRWRQYANNTGWEFNNARN